MKEVVGFIRKVTNGYDHENLFIYPILLIENNEIHEIDLQQRVDLFPNRGTIYINQYSKEEFNYFFETGLVRVSFDPENDLSTQYNASDANSCKYAVNKYQLVRFKSDELIEIIESKYPIEHILESTRSRTIISAINPLNKKIMVKVDNYLYGPFDFISIKNDNNTYELKLSADQNQNYIIQKYNYNSLTEIVYSSKTSYYSTEQRTFIYNLNKLKIYEPIEHIDFIEDNRLINILKTILSNYKELKLTNEQLKNIKSVLLNNNLNIKEQLTDYRISRICNLENLSEHLINFKEMIMENYLASDSSKSFKESYVKENLPSLLDHDEFKVVKDEYYRLSNEIEIKKATLHNFIDNKIKLEQELEEKVKNSKKEEILILNNTIKTLDEKLENKKITLDNITQKLKVVEKFISLKEKNKTLKKEVEELSLIKSKYEFEIKSLQGNIEKKIEEITTNAYNQTLFKKYYYAITSDNDDNTNIYNNYAIPTNIDSSVKAEDIIIKVSSDFKKINRELSEFDILNYIITITQNFITVFAGEPGTGKTSFTRLLAKSLGLYNDRYLHIPVSRGWTSQKDLIGYYNPLTKTMEKSETGFYDYLLKINKEASSYRNDIPFFVVLDEANLSPIEHYLSSFMSIYDNPEKTPIILGGNNSIHLTKSFKFLATINHDHTTERLSPRFLNRTAIILMEKSNSISFDEDFSNEHLLENNKNIISYDLLNKYFNVANEELNLDNKLRSLIERIYEACSNNETANLMLSYRTTNAIKKYCIVAQKYFGAEELNKAADYAIAQYLLPNINGYGDNYKKLITNLYNICEGSQLLKSHHILNKILKDGNEEHGYYSFFK